MPPLPSLILGGQPLSIPPCRQSEKMYAHFCTPGPVGGHGDTEEEKMDVGLSLESLEPVTV